MQKIQPQFGHSTTLSSHPGQTASGHGIGSSCLHRNRGFGDALSQAGMSDRNAPAAPGAQWQVAASPGSAHHVSCSPRLAPGCSGSDNGSGGGDGGSDPLGNKESSSMS